MITKQQPQIIEVPIQDTFFNSAFIQDYLESGKISERFHYPLNEKGIQDCINHRKEFSQKKRDVLYESLKLQYSDFKDDELAMQNIEKLKNSNCFTVTTGQQIHVGLGPLYVAYKTLDTINTAIKLKKKYPEYDFVPIFWMATEDHDLEEIKEVKFYSHSFKWETTQHGAVGRMKCDGISNIFEQIKEMNPDAEQLQFIEKCINAYSNSDNLADAFRKIIHSVFPNTGLVVLNPDCCILKKNLIEVAIQDLQGRNNECLISGNKEIEASGYDTQLYTRKINFFFLTENDRERIICENENWVTVSNQNLCEPKDLEKFVTQNISNISPNAALRPLYQEIILPNIAYIGGQAELKYWAQLKETFERNAENICIFIPRSHWTIVDGLPSSPSLKYWFEKDELFLEKIDTDSKEYSKIIEKDILDTQIKLDELKSKVETFLPGFSAESKIVKIKEKLIDFQKTYEKMSVALNKNERNKKLFKLKKKYFNPNNVQERNEHIISLRLSLKTLVSIEIKSLTTNTKLGFYSQPPFSKVFCNK
jgi:bacillithiol biosynthesis cysteine-adding enzyme BshC